MHHTDKHYVNLRFLVGALGEREQYGWWDTGFLSTTGLRYSEINFPRAAVAAAGVSVTEAARRLHDARIGKGGVFHLFRLPPAVEESVHKEMLHGDQEAFKAAIFGKDQALEALEQYADKPVDGQDGPVQVGTVKTILHSPSIATAAAYYLDAFRNNRKTFPYFIDRGP